MPATRLRKVALLVRLEPLPANRALGSAQLAKPTPMLTLRVFACLVLLELHLKQVLGSHRHAHLRLHKCSCYWGVSPGVLMF